MKVFFLRKEGRPIREWRFFLEDGTELPPVVGAARGMEPEWMFYGAGHPLSGSDRHVHTLELSFLVTQIERIDAPPPGLTERLRALAAKWCEGQSGPRADRENTAAEVARETCAEELEALLDEVRP